MIAQIKIDIIEKITHLDDKQTLEFIHRLIGEVDSPKPYTMDELDLEIDSALHDSKNNKVKKASQLKTELKNWS